MASIKNLDAIGVNRLPLRVFDKLTATVTALVVLFTTPGRAVFHHVVRVATWTNEVGFHGKLEEGKAQLLPIFLYPLPNGTTRLVRALAAIKNGDRDWPISDILQDALKNWVQLPENQELIQKHNLDKLD